MWLYLMGGFYLCNEEYQKNKLKRMKFISTGILILVGIVYFVCKKFSYDQSNNLFYSSIAAFTEASIVGAIADWFAVVALFRHPFGLRIPHTAIIKKNKNAIGESLANFVVNNFLGDEQINNMLNKMKISNIELIDIMLRWGASGCISSNKESIGDHISETVKGWDEDDMVEKLEMQVGSDLQFIRINGTIVGGLIGLVLHLITHLFT